MRLSALAHDPGNRQEEVPHAVIYLDGERVQHVVTADEEQRCVVVEEWDETLDRPVLRDDRIALRVVVGQVRIAFRSDSPEWIRQDYPDRVEETGS